MNDTRAIQILLDFEESAEGLLFEQAPGSDAYLWPLLRWPIASALASAHLQVTPHQQLPRRMSASEYFKLKARRILPSPWSSNRIRRPAPHLFMVSGVTRTATARGAGNWLCDAFAGSLGDAAIVVQESELDLLTSRAIRPLNRRTWSRHLVASRIGRESRRAPLPEHARTRVLSYLTQVFQAFGSELPQHAHDGITQELLGRLSRLPFEEQEFHSLLDRVRPEQLYMEDASYGHYSPAIRIAHERGVKVAELQHGWIGASHAAYNYSGRWFDSPLTSSLPDTLITFGDYWGEELRFPGRIIPVGKPHLERAYLAAPPYAERPQRVLVVSSVYEQEQLLATTLQLRKHLPASWEVALRPHPTERRDAATLFAPALRAGVTLDDEPDANASIARSRGVVGLVSTVLFEALPFGVHIGVIESGLAEHYADATVFPTRLRSEASITEFTRTLTAGVAPAQEATTRIWHTNAVDTFLSVFAAG